MCCWFVFLLSVQRALGSDLPVGDEWVRGWSSCNTHRPAKNGSGKPPPVPCFLSDCSFWVRRGPSILSHHCLSTALQTGPGSSWLSRRCLLFGLFHSQALMKKSSPGPSMICTSYLGTTCRSFRGHITAVDRGRENKFLNPSTLQFYMQSHLLL